VFDWPLKPNIGRLKFPGTVLRYENKNNVWILPENEITKFLAGVNRILINE